MVRGGGSRGGTSGSAAGGLAAVAEIEGADAAPASPRSSPAATRQGHLQQEHLQQQRLAQEHLQQQMLAAQAQAAQRRSCGPWRCVIDGETVSLRVGSRSRNAEFAKWISGAKMQVFANSAAERASAGPKAAAEAGLLGVAQLTRVVERCHNVPLKRGMDLQLVATTPRADTTGSRALSSVWRQVRDEKGDRERRLLYLYRRSAISRSTAHDETRRRHLCYCSNE